MKNTKKNLILAAAMTVAMGYAQAQVTSDPGTSAAPAADVVAAEATPDHVFSFNAALVSDYRFRGISQTRKKPTIQGGADYTNTPTGLYVGTWASGVNWIKDGGGNNDYELDVYVGKRGEIVKDVTYDVGYLKYFYPNNDIGATTGEVYAQLGFGPAYIKYSYSTSNLFGFADSSDSGYVDVGANVEMTDGFILNLHIGRQDVKNNHTASYNDFKIGVTKDFGVATVSVAGIYADTDAYVSRKGKNLATSGLVVTISKVF